MPQTLVLDIKDTGLFVDGVTSIEAGDHPIALCRIGEAFYAFPDTCTHEEWPLSESYLVNGMIVCSLHGAMFDPSTGECRRGPACDPLRTYPVRKQAETLSIELEDEP